MRNWPNYPVDMTLEAACEEITRNHKPGVTPYLERIGLEVEDAAGVKHTLYPLYDSLGFPPKLGETVECTGLGLGLQFTVVGYAIGYPGGFEIHRLPYRETDGLGNPL